MLEKQESLYNIYFNDIYPKIEDIEIFRRQLLSKVLIQMCLFSPLFGIMLAVLAYYDNKNIIEAVFLGIFVTIFLMVVWFLANPQKKIYTTKLKNDYFSAVIKAFAEINLWQRNKAISEVLPDNELDESGLFSKFTQRKNDDEFRGIYKGVGFCVSESQLVLNDGFTRPNTVFKGLIIKFNSNKNISQRTIIVTQREGSPSLFKALLGFVLGFVTLLIKMHFSLEGLILGIISGVICALFIYLYSNLGLTKKESKSDIKLECTDFAKHFKVFSEDEVEARYLLTPSFIEKFTKLKNVMRADTVKCSFYNNSIMIAIYSDKDFFELGDLYKNVSDASTVEKFYKEISAILDLVDYFNLDSKTGL